MTIEIISLSVNNTNQIEVVYDKVTTYPDGFVRKEREGRVWSPTDDMASDTLSGAHPDVLKLAQTYWSKEVVTGFSKEVLAVQAAERAKIEAAMAEVAQKQAELEAAKTPAADAA